jgi:hypothetical protein
MLQYLEIFDLGDVMIETKCSAAGGPFVDYLWGPNHWTC